MKRILSSGWLVVILGAAVACGGAKYYMVKDPSTGKVYYSENIKKEGGAVTLTDAQTSSTVTIQNSEISEVSEQTYKQGLAAPPPAAAPAAAPATAPATTPPPATPPAK
jgi:hypothetical protein